MSKHDRDLYSLAESLDHDFNKALDKIELLLLNYEELQEVAQEIITTKKSIMAKLVKQADEEDKG